MPRVKRHGYRLRYRWPAVPSLMIAAGWVGLWALWPRPGDGPGGGTPAGLLPPSRVAYLPPSEGGRPAHMDPALFGLPSAVGFSVRQAGKAVPGMLDWFRNPDPAYLEPPSGRAGPYRAAEAARAALPEGEGGVFMPRAAGNAVFDRVKPRPGLRVDLDRELEACGFKVRAFPEASLKTIDKPWALVLFVNLDGEGKPSYVIEETGTADPATARLAAWCVRTGHAAAKGAECSGRVRLAFEPGG